MKRIAITLGDPDGIGPEVALKATHGLEYPVVLIGPMSLRQHPLIGDLCRDLPITTIHPDHLSTLPPSEIGWIDIGWDTAVPPTIPKAISGHIARKSIDVAIALAQSGQISAITTAPISKENQVIAGYKEWDHTSILGQHFGLEPTMAFYSKSFNVVLTTIHVPLRDVPSMITADRLATTITRTSEWLGRLGISTPKIAVAGLNPHAGENGVLGSEETEIIVPTIRALTERYPLISGPFPADTLFSQAHRYDCIVAMYHDQGLAPLKTVAFDSAVNVTLGLPIIRTSPDHGTASDIAYLGKANPMSMRSAIELAWKLANGT
ncbi:4-hydroxythreonine-4-phosphate dehydrogenase PdxA [bacterium]|nr:4-hydroxythreonine-4-phosphate dehydrogenase PdxA [bacterium]